MRRGEALHAPALLVDEHWGIAAHGIAKGRDQAAQLRRRVDVAAEEDEPPRLALAQERALGARQGRAGKASDESAYRHWRGSTRA
jgi:hypothetical protein